MIFIPEHIADLSPYRPGKSSDPATYSHYKAILSSNENNYGPSPFAQNAIVKAVSQIHLYPDPQGDFLTTKLAQLHHRAKDEMILSNGLDGLLYTLFKAFTVSGDEVITNEKSFIAFSKFAKMNNLDLIQVPNRNYFFDLDAILNLVSEKTRIIYLCNPNNPTGARIKTETLVNFLSLVPEQVLVVVDEAYYNYALAIDPDFPDSGNFNFPNLLTLRTFSKLFGMAGLRIGYGISRKPIIDALKQVKLVFNPNTLAQIGARAALDDHDHIMKTLNNNTRWISRIEQILDSKGIRYIKSYANFICTLFPDSRDAAFFFDYMDKNGVLLRKLDGFAIPEGVRISIGNENEMDYFAEVLNDF